MALLLVGLCLPAVGCRRYVWPAAYLPAEHEAYWTKKIAEVDAEASVLPPARREEIFGPGPQLRKELELNRTGDRSRDELLDMTLFTAIRLALQHNQVIRQDTQFLSTTNPILGTIDTTSSIFDPAIQDTNVLFGSRGVGAALADFVPTLSGNLTWGRDETVLNQLGLPSVQDSTADFDLVLSKQLATGGSLALAHNVDYFGSDGRAIGRDAYSGSLAATFTYPLLAASGTEFTQIAGPADFLVPRVTSVNQGVLISRINSDISRLDLELNIRQLVRDVVNVYWDLTLAFGQYEAEEAGLVATEKLYKQQQARLETGQASRAEFAQAAETFLSSRSRKQEALRSIDENEQRLRRLLGLPVSDGRLIRPADDPELVPLPENWNGVVVQALSRRPQLKRTKYNLRSLQLQLKAARKLVKPRLDFISSYRVNGFGDELAGEGGSQPFDSFYGSIGASQLEGWTLGFNFNMPLNFQLERSQVDNIELRVAKNRVQLAAQEAEIAHEIAVALQNAQNRAEASKLEKTRLKAAQTLVDALEAEEEAGRPNLDRLVRAQAGLAQARIDFNRSLVEFSRANSELQFRRSMLLESNGIELQFPAVTIAEDYDKCSRLPIANKPATGIGHTAAGMQPGQFFQQHPVAPRQGLPVTEDPDVARSLDASPDRQRAAEVELKELPPPPPRRPRGETPALPGGSPPDARSPASPRNEETGPRTLPEPPPRRSLDDDPPPPQRLPAPELSTQRDRSPFEAFAR